MKQKFVILNDRRYRESTIKSYEPFQQSNIFGIYVYFSTSREKPDRIYHKFSSEEERDKQLLKLDEVYGIKY